MGRGSSWSHGSLGQGSSSDVAADCQYWLVAEVVAAEHEAARILTIRSHRAAHRVSNIGVRWLLQVAVRHVVERRPGVAILPFPPPPPDADDDQNDDYYKCADSDAQRDDENLGVDVAFGRT